ncbi:fumarylacetoacetate hydrolase family protein [Streptomyces sp. NPDC021098]|uniref:fumarylacetoacetate hydrolase family protein n=1 Tax=unclassified Streptomyces TaxID=2593676 RepID=UPI0037B90DBD
MSGPHGDPARDNHGPLRGGRPGHSSPGSERRLPAPGQHHQNVRRHRRAVTLRDWQYRTKEWLQGKTWEATTPLGPCLVTPDELAPDAEISCTVDNEVVQKSHIGDLLFDAADLVSYISTMITLNPGDLIATGTTGGVGHARTPPRYLRDGQTVVTRIDGIGELVTQVRRGGAS